MRRPNKAEIRAKHLNNLGNLLNRSSRNGTRSKTTSESRWKMKTDLRPYHWHENNTKYSEWFERDRAMVRITDMRDREIMCLWDSEVQEFIADGFKTSRQSWHKALVEYATDRKLKARKK